jgi:hypothetical protein
LVPSEGNICILQLFCLNANCICKTKNIFIVIKKGLEWILKFLCNIVDPLQVGLWN